MLTLFRSWATQILFMEDYPEYKFTASQAQQYEWLKEVLLFLFVKHAIRLEERLF